MIVFNPVSSVIDMVSFEEKTTGLGELKIRFKSGAEETKTDFPTDLFLQFQAAQSAGQFYNLYVKNVAKVSEWKVFGKAIEDIPLGSRIEMEMNTGRVRRAQLKPL